MMRLRVYRYSRRIQLLDQNMFYLSAFSRRYIIMTIYSKIIGRNQIVAQSVRFRNVQNQLFFNAFENINNYVNKQRTVQNG